MTAQTTLDEFHDLLEQKAGLLADYREWTLKIKEVLALQKTELLEHCLGKRHRSIKRIDSIDASLKKMLGRIGKESPVAREKTMRVLKNIQQLLSNIADLDQECNDVAQSERKRLKDEVLQYHQRRQGAKGYRKAPAGSARFIDTRIK